MIKRRLFVINLLYKLGVYNWKLPEFIREWLFDFISHWFEEESIDVYLNDRQDFGFMENFIMGSVESKKISVDTNKTIQAIKKTQITEQVRGDINRDFTKHRYSIEKDETVSESITDKKLKCIEVLQEKDEIIKYFGRKIVSRNKTLYMKIERLYHSFKPK